eukprot:1650580-Ditylum_brightwellii.AAC.1
MQKSNREWIYHGHRLKQLPLLCALSFDASNDKALAIVVLANVASAPQLTMISNPMHTSNR